MYKLTNTESITRLTDNATIPNDERNTDYQEYLSWVAQGNVAEPYQAPAPTLEELTEAIRAALQSAIDERAKAYGFSGGNSLMLYAGFTNFFQPLAQTFATWEASVWVEAEMYKADVLAELKPMLSPEEAVAMMPAYPTENEVTV
jgi:hypothetical protein